MTNWTTGIELSDYKIRSIKIYRFTLIALFAIVTSLLISELTLELKASSPLILIPALFLLALVLYLSYRFPNSSSIRIVFSFLAFLIVQIHFFYDPTSFHALSYWFPFIPLIALIISGVRISLIWLFISIVTLVFDFAYINKQYPGGYDLTIAIDAVVISGVIFALAIMTNSYLLYYLLGAAYERAKQKSAELIEVKEKVEFKKNLLETYMKEFVKFSRESSNFSHGKPHLFQSICKTIAETLKVNRVSIWFFEEDGAHLVRECLFEKDGTTDEIIRLKNEDYPYYFQSLHTRPYILASDARTDVYTKEFTASYLKPLDIYSMLDCPIVIDHQPVGVICCENQYEIKRWNMEDVLFIQSFTDLIAVNQKNRRIELLVEELKKTNRELTRKNREIELMNNALDTTVQQRTKALKSQNAKLTEYSFINSHLLRAPLSRIIGLSQAIEKEVNSPNEKHLIKALLDSSDELDSIIHKINDVLYSGNGLTREDLISIERDIKQTKQKEQSSEQLESLHIKKKRA